ncbi:MAG TPA: energy transducer TonB [Thermoanaerobaculia bacterium]
MPAEPAAPDTAAPDTAVPSYLIDDPREGRRLRLAVAAALACHLPLLLLPELGGEVTAAPEVEEPPVIVLQSPRFRPPEPPPEPPERPPVVEERPVVVPVPDPTPIEPEPIREIELPPPVEPLPVDVVFLPPPPPEPAPAAAPPEVLRVGGRIARPRQLFAPRPSYTEAARRARIEGTVILEVRLDAAGRVDDVTVLRGQPFGLTESAVAAVSRWRYEPARLGGRAVPVLMTVTVHFELS